MVLAMSSNERRCCASFANGDRMPADVQVACTFGEMLPSRVTVGSGQFASEPHHGGVGGSRRDSSGGAAAGGLIDRLEPGHDVADGEAGPVRQCGCRRIPQNRWRSWRSSAARCSILPKPSTDLGPKPTHLLVPATPHTRACPCGLPSRARASSGPTARSATRDAVERKARGGHAAEQFSKRSKHSMERNRAVTQRRNFPKGNSPNPKICAEFAEEAFYVHHQADGLEAAAVG